MCPVIVFDDFLTVPHSDEDVSAVSVAVYYLYNCTNLVNIVFLEVFDAQIAVFYQTSVKLCDVHICSL